jgi:hypothetical protein
MKIISPLQNIYGKIYGTLVFGACTFFTLAGLVWFTGLMIKHKKFNIVALLLILSFGTQLIYHKKLAALVSGIITLFFSLWLFMGVTANRSSLPGVFTIGIILSLLGIVSSGILIFSFLHAFKHSEKL